MTACNDSLYDSPASFYEKELLFNDAPKGWTDCGYEINSFQTRLYESFQNENDFLRSARDKVESQLVSFQEKIKREKEVLLVLQQQKDSLLEKVCTTKIHLKELLLQKDYLKQDKMPLIKEDELTEMFQTVLHLEKEQETRAKDMKKRFKILTATICHYKAYLDIFVDLNLNSYILYFNRKKDQDSEHQKWIRIQTEDFENFYVVESSLMDLIKPLLDTRISLRNLIFEARKYAFQKRS